MQKENAQAQQRKAESTDASVRGGPLRSSDEADVTAAERRGWAVQFKLGQPVMGGTLLLGRKAPAFHGLHEPDDVRASRPESVSGQRCNSSGRLGSRLAGLQRARAEGRVGGRPKAEEAEPKLAAKIGRLRSQGLSIGAIALEVRKSPNTILRLLKFERATA